MYKANSLRIIRWHGDGGPQDGQVRHIPGFTDWHGQKTPANGGTYQSGAF